MRVFYIAKLILSMLELQDFVTINSDLSFEYHHYGVKVSITTLSKNKIFRLDRWSKVNEVIRYFNCLEVDHKHQVLLKHLDSLGSVKVGMKMYDPEVMVMAFEHAAKNPDTLATSVLGIMLDAMHGGPKMLAKMVTVAKLNAEFLDEVIENVMKTVEESGGFFLI